MEERPVDNIETLLTSTKPEELSQGLKLAKEAILVTDLGLDLTGWQLDTATGISADGMTIVGHGNNPNGFTEAWIATIPESRHALTARPWRPAGGQTPTVAQQQNRTR